MAAKCRHRTLITTIISENRIAGRGASGYGHPGAWGGPNRPENSHKRKTPQKTKHNDPQLFLGVEYVSLSVVKSSSGHETSRQATDLDETFGIPQSSFAGILPIAPKIENSMFLGKHKTHKHKLF